MCGDLIETQKIQNHEQLSKLFLIYFGKVTANQKIHVSTIFTKVGHVTRQNYNGRNSDVSLSSVPHRLWDRDV